MPLTILYDSRADDAEAIQELERLARDLPRPKRRHAVMQMYLTVSNPGEDTCLMTDSVETCQVLIVHKEPGVGALGHLGGGEQTPDSILTQLHRMNQNLGGGPVSAMFVSLGDVGVSVRLATQTGREPTDPELRHFRLDYKFKVIGRSRGMFAPGAPYDIYWSDIAQPDIDAALYFPNQETVVFYEMGLPPSIFRETATTGVVTDGQIAGHQHGP